MIRNQKYKTTGDKSVKTKAGEGKDEKRERERE